MNTVITLVFKMTELGDPSNGFRRRVTTPSFCLQWIKEATPCRMDCPEPWAEAERSDKISEEFRQEKIESEYSSEGRKKLLGSGRILKEEPRGFADALDGNLKGSKELKITPRILA